MASFSVSGGLGRAAAFFRVAHFLTAASTRRIHASASARCLRKRSRASKSIQFNRPYSTASIAQAASVLCLRTSPPVRFYNSTTVRREGQSSSNPTTTNGHYLKYAMQYHDSVAFLVSNDLGIPTWMAKEEGSNNDKGKTPAQVAQQFDLSVRAASALLVTLCRMDVVQILKDCDDSVDEITYTLTLTARTFLGNPNADSYTSPFIDTFHTNFMRPEKLLESFRPVERKDIMSEHLEQSDEEVANNARHFMSHMNAQSYCCAEAFPSALGLTDLDQPPVTLLDIGGGSAIFTIAAARASAAIAGIVYELPAIKPITEGYIADAGLADRVTVTAGDFFSDDPFPNPVDVVLFSNILHDWPDETNMTLLGKAYDCLSPGGRVVISELLLADDVKSSTASSTSMNVIMLPYTKGRQYRAKELFRRLSKVGFVNSHEAPLVDDYSLVIAEKPNV